MHKEFILDHKIDSPCIFQPRSTCGRESLFFYLSVGVIWCHSNHKLVKTQLEDSRLVLTIAVTLYNDPLILFLDVFHNKGCQTIALNYSGHINMDKYESTWMDNGYESTWKDMKQTGPYNCRTILSYPLIFLLGLYNNKGKDTILTQLLELQEAMESFAFPDKIKLTKSFIPCFFPICQITACFPSISLPRGIASKCNHYVEAHEPPLSVKVSFARIVQADWMLPGENQRVSNSVFKVTRIKHIQSKLGLETILRQRVRGF